MDRKDRLAPRKQVSTNKKRYVFRPLAGATYISYEELHGAAKRVAQMSNIGGGSKATGGGGIDKGLDTLTKYAQAKTAKTMMDKSKQKKLRKKKSVCLLEKAVT